MTFAEVGGEENWSLRQSGGPARPIFLPIGSDHCTERCWPCPAPIICSCGTVSQSISIYLNRCVG